MPNVEIHGLGKGEVAIALVRKIYGLFEGEPYAKAMVVSVYDDLVVDREGETQPFLRLVNSHHRHTKKILGKLRQIDMDLKHLKLKAFYPKGSRISLPD